MADPRPAALAGTVFGFGRCRIDPQRRMLWRDEAPVAIEPKAFDVLVHLVMHRQRVVPVAELGQAVWAGRDMSRGSVHRSLALVRQAIGDVAGRDAMIRTVHRIGYQFVAAVQVFAGEVAAASVEPALRIVHRPVGPDAEPIAQVVSGLFRAALARHLRCDPSPGDGEAAAFDFLIEAEARSEGGQLWLDGRIERADGCSSFFSVRDGDRQNLAERAARRAAEMIERHKTLFVEPAFDDPVAERLHARAIELAALDEIEAAASVLELLARLQPDRMPRQLGRQLVLRHGEDPRIARYAQRLLDQATASDDEDTAQAARLALARLEGSAPRPPDADHTDTLGPAALEAALSESRELSELELDVLLRVATDDLLACGFDDAAVQQMARVVEVLERSGGARRAATACGLLASIRITRDELHQASVDLERYIRLQETGAALLAFPNACSIGSWLQARLGDHGRAAALADRVVVDMAGVRLLEPETYILSGVALAMLEFGDAARLRRVCASLKAVGDADASVAPPALRLSEAALRLAEGHAADATQLIQDAQESPALDRYPGIRQTWGVLLLRLQLGQADIFGARRQLARLRGHTRGCPSPLLAAWNHRIRASQHLAHADRKAALDALLDVLLVAPAGQLLALARLDAAWLHAEAGRPHEAAALWSGAGTWATQHPIGRSVQARIAAARGDHAEAVRCQAAALSAAPGAVPELQRRLHAAFAAAAQGGCADLPSLERFASESWWIA